MSTFVEAILLGLVQGLTEFLPISSSGHLALLQALLGWEDPDANLAFAVAVHLGSLLAVLVFVRREIVVMLTSRPRLLLVLIVATLPIALVGPFAKDAVSSLATKLWAVGLFLLVTAGILTLARRVGQGRTESAALPLRRALLPGIGQLIAILPGVSRSGASLVGGMAAGLEREQAVRFSFLMAGPAIAGAGLFLALDGGWSNGSIPFASTLAGGAVSFVASLLAMKLMVRVVVRERLSWFALYCACVGSLAIVLHFVRG